jgi:hypothetical protein
MAEKKETVILDVEVDAEDSIKSINDLTAANKELRKERNALNLNSEQGKKRAQELNAVIDQNTSKIKANVSAIEQQKINIGNYKSALDNVNPAFGKLAAGLEQGASGFKAMTLQALRFIATPIGAIIAALVAVFTLLKTAISTNNELFDKFENVTNAVGVVIDVVINRVGKLGEALVLLASGDISGAIDKTSEAFGGLADEIERAVGEGQLILEMTRDVEDATRQLRIEQAKQENEIRRLVVASKNRNISLDEQEGFLRRALALEEDLVNTRTKIAEKELEIAVRSIANTENISKASEESYQQFAERLIKNSQLSDDQVDGLVENIEKLESARGSSLAFQEKLENNLSSIQEKRTEVLKKQNEALAEQAAQERAIRRAQNIESTEVDDPLIGAFETRATIVTDINQRMNDDLAKMNKQFADEEAERIKKGAELEVQVERSKVAIIGNLTGSLAALAEEDTEAHKILASAQAVINTYLAATAALASGSEINPIFGILSAAAAVAAGLKSVAEINNVEFAEGGWTGPGPKYKPAGIVHAGEVVWNQEDVAKVGGPAAANAMRPTARYRNAISTRFLDGGVVTNAIAQPVNDQMFLSNIMKNIPPSEISVVEFNKVNRRVSVKEKISKR